MTTIRKYRCKCTTEGIDVYWWLPDSSAAPTTCPNNSSHAVTDVTVEESYSAQLPLVTQPSGAETVAVDVLQHPPGWTYLCLGFAIEIPETQAARYVQYRQVLNEAGASMDFRAWTGKCFTQNCNIADNFKIELVIKGSSLGGVDDTHDLVLDQFVRNAHPLNNVQRQFSQPDKSILIPAYADELNPLLPHVGIFFKVVYTPAVAAGANQWLIFDLEGFEPPAA